MFSAKEEMPLVKTASTCPASATQFFHSVEEAAKCFRWCGPEKPAKQNIGGVKTGKALIALALHYLAKLHRLCRSCRQAFIGPKSDPNFDHLPDHLHSANSPRKCDGST